MSTPSTPLRSVLTAEALIGAINGHVTPSDLAVAITTIQGEKVSKAGMGVGVHQHTLRTVRGYLEGVVIELAGIHDAMDLIGVPTNNHTDGGEGGVTPELGGSNHSVALPRGLDAIMDHPTDAVDAMIEEAFPDRKSIIDSIAVELAVEDAAQDAPLALLGPGGDHRHFIIP